MNLRPPPTAPVTVAVIVTWNSVADILACLAALATSTAPPAAVVVVDNASADGTLAAIRAAYPAVELLPQPRNGHFAHAANLGLAWAIAFGADAALVLNPDATLAPGALAEMQRVLASDPTIGLIGGRLEHPARPGHPARTIVGANCDYATGIITEPPPPADPALDHLPVDYAWGCALLIRAAALREVGAFDSSLIAYYEDTDLCLRAAAAGWRTVTALHAHVTHRGGVAGDRRYWHQAYLRARNWLRVLYRHAPRRQRLSLLISMLATQLPRFAWSTLKTYLTRPRLAA